jgi:SAM-dependent methyltransferase
VTALDTDPDRGLYVQDRFAAGDAPPRVVADETTFRQWMMEHGIAVEACDVERDRFPCADDSVDAVVMTEVIEHLWSDPLWTLAECNRVLRKDAVLLLSTPNLTSLPHRLAFLRGHMADVIQPPYMAFLERRQIGHAGHVRLYAPGELQDLLHLCGFSTEVHALNFDYWEGSRPTDAHSAPAQGGLRRRFRLGWFLRSPRRYWQAVKATVCAAFENRFPALRRHLFVIARKNRRVDINALTRADVIG